MISTGYKCKNCHSSAPMGVGYAFEGLHAASKSASIIACACGYSRAPQDDSPAPVAPSGYDSAQERYFDILAQQPADTQLAHLERMDLGEWIAYGRWARAVQ